MSRVRNTCSPSCAGPLTWSAEVPFDNIDPVTKYVAAALSYASPREEWWGNYHMHPLIQRRRRKVLGRGMRVLPTRPMRC